MYSPLTSRIPCDNNAVVADSRLYVARPTAALILAAAVALLTAEVLLLRRNGVLQAELAAERRILIPPVGWQLPALHGLAPDGRARGRPLHRWASLVGDRHGCWVLRVQSFPPKLGSRCFFPTGVGPASSGGCDARRQLPDGFRVAARCRTKPGNRPHPYRSG